MEHIHPALVHFPIAFYLLETFLLLLWIVHNNKAYREFAYFVFKSGYFLMWFTLAAGLYEAGGIKPALEHARAHFFSALSVMTVSTGRFVLWRSSLQSKLWLLISALILSALVIVTSYFGGELVFG
ncbi:MAG: DUF2231 domain-containing protein [Candidatus Omnitrophica bacterium]|nr:DUF2231 domain-containing protein [Candidatus Omnitrophota bacterium]